MSNGGLYSKSMSNGGLCGLKGVILGSTDYIQIFKVMEMYKMQHSKKTA